MTISLLTTRASVDSEDYIDWTGLGTFQINPFTASSAGARTLTVSALDTIFLIMIQGTDWNGNFEDGESVLVTPTEPDQILRIEFPGDGVYAAGAQIQPDTSEGAFEAQIEAFAEGNSSLGALTEVGNSSFTGGNTAIFLGVSSGTPIIAIEYKILSSQPITFDRFAINRLDFRLTISESDIPDDTSQYSNQGRYPTPQVHRTGQGLRYTVPFRYKR